ncbi:MAG: long-chain fatty acid--CoA ligase [Acuticoccus sp.]
MRYYGATLEHPRDVARILQKPLALFPDRSALVTFDGTWSYRELEAMADCYARNLMDLGVKPGDRVASLLPNCGKLFVHYLGCLKLGAVLVPLNYRYTSREIAHAIGVSEARAIVYDAERTADIDAAEGIDTVSLRLAADTHAMDGDDDVTPLLTRPSGNVLLPVAPDAPAVIYFTSGSTGPAKGVTHTHRTFGWIIASSIQTYQLAPDDRVLAALSCSHVGGSMLTLSAFFEGAMVLAPRVGDPRRQLEMMRQHRATVAVLLPAALFDLERSQYARTEDFASLRVCISGGDKVPEQLEKEFSAKTGLPIDELYGMTEIGLSHINPSSGLVKFGSFGRVAPGYAAEIRDEARQPVAAGEMGRLWVKFPGTLLAYWNRPEATAEVHDDDGWFDTGDIVSVDTEGYFTFCGRKKQIIVHDGSNIFPQEVEDAVLEHPAVEKVGVVGVHDTVHGENVRAYVAIKPGATAPDPVDLIAFAAERVGYKAPERIVFLDEIPVNPTGKVDRVTLKKLATEDV